MNHHSNESSSSRRSDGFSLIEVLVTVAIAIIASTALASIVMTFTKNFSSSKATAMAMSEKSEVLNSLINQQTWMKNVELNRTTAFNCIFAGQPCPAAGVALKIVDSGGSVIVGLDSDHLGFDQSGNPCNSNEANCIFKRTAKWFPKCLAPNCNPRVIRVVSDLQMVHQPSGAWNPKDYTLQILKTIPIPKSCEEVLDMGIGSTNGVYTIDPDGPEGPSDPFQAYCDMVDQGGGWTLVLNVKGSGSVFTYDSSYYTNTALLNGNIFADHSVDSKYQAYLSVPFTQVLLRGHSLGERTCDSTVHLYSYHEMGHVGESRFGCTPPTPMPRQSSMLSAVKNTPSHQVDVGGEGGSCRVSGFNVHLHHSACGCTTESYLRIGVISYGGCCTNDIQGVGQITTHSGHGTLSYAAAPASIGADVFSICPDWEEVYVK